MRMLALACNVASLAFTLLVLLTDGVSVETSYRVLTIAVVLVPCVSLAVLLRGRGMPTPSAALVAPLLNVGLLLAICWAIVDQYPHPNEPGFLPYVILALLTPIVTLFALRPGGGWRARRHDADLRNA